MADLQMLDGDPGRLFLDDEDSLDNFNDEDASLSEMDRLEMSVGSEQCFVRQTAAKSLASVLQNSNVSVDDAGPVFRSVVRLSDDPDGAVRIELTKQLFDIVTCCGRRGNQYLIVIAGCILPTVVKLLSDSHGEVRNIAQRTLLNMIDSQCVQHADIESQILPVIVHLLDQDSPDDFRAENIPLMIDLIPICGPVVTEDHFLPRFTHLCAEPLFQVRKACAVSFGRLCQTVSQDVIETSLLPRFAQLCDDGVWGVRKACAESFAQVASACTVESRGTILIQLYLGLVNDQSRWVRMAAFQALGSFIFSFADPRRSEFKLLSDGTLVRVPDPEIDSSSEQRTETENDSRDHSVDEDSPMPMDLADGADVISPIDEPDVPAEEPVNLGSSEQENRAVEQSDKSCISNGNENISLETLAADTAVTEPEINITNVSEAEAMQADVSPPSHDAANSQPDFDSGRVGSASCQIYGLDVRKKTENETAVESVPEPDVRMETVPLSSDENKNNSAASAANTDSSLVTDISADDETEEISGGKSSEVNPINVESTAMDISENVSSPKNSYAADVTESSDDVPSELPEAGDPDIPPSLETPKPTIEVQISNETEPETMMETDIRIPDDLGNSDDAGKSTTNGNNGGVRVLTASLREMAGPSEETVTHIGSTHIHVADELRIVDGVVQPVDDVVKVDVTRRPVTLTLRDDLSVEADYNFTGLDDDDEPKPELCDESYGEMSLKHMFLKKRSGLARFGMFSSRKQDVETVVVDLKPVVQTGSNPLNQSIVPNILLDHYISMTDPSRIQSVDSEIAYHCAYNLPAVAYTLGRRNWPYIRDLFHSLARDMQWKVRRTLAFSIDRLAVILGEELTLVDLLPIYDELLHDVDEVRTALVQNLASFLRLLPIELRREFLPKLTELLNIDNIRNWRYRVQVAKQLGSLFELFSVSEIHQSILPLLLHILARDPIAEVRQNTIEVLGRLYWRLSDADDEQKLNELVKEFVELFAQHNRWLFRQLFVSLCSSVLSRFTTDDQNRQSETDFELPPTRLSAVTALHLLMPPLLALHTDKVPNVRIAVARCIVSHIATTTCFTADELSPHQTDLQNATEKLRRDSDRDVRYMIGRLPPSASDVSPVNSTAVVVATENHSDDKNLDASSDPISDKENDEQTVDSLTQQVALPATSSASDSMPTPTDTVEILSS